MNRVKLAQEKSKDQHLTIPLAKSAVLRQRSSETPVFALQQSQNNESLKRDAQAEDSKHYSSIVDSDSSSFETESEDS